MAPGDKIELRHNERARDVRRSFKRLTTVAIDDDGNAVFVFEGASCASGPSPVIADVPAGTHSTSTLEFSVLPPPPAI
jgi:hypothetical protein